MNFALMFNVLEGGVSTPIKWGKENLTSDRSVIILDEASLTVWLWYGKKQGLVARRTALRQAQSLKGHGYTVGKSIIGRDIKTIKEIDERKIGREPETDELNAEFQEIFNKNYKELEGFIVTASADATGAPVSKPKAKPEPKPVKKTLPKPVVKPTVDTAAKPAPSKTVSAPKIEKAVGEKPLEEVKAAFVIKAVLDHFDDVWVSKKSDGSYTVEMLDGPVCQFSIKEGTVKFSAKSFSSIDPNIKSEIQKKFIELSKLIN